MSLLDTIAGAVGLGGTATTLEALPAKIDTMENYAIVYVFFTVAALSYLLWRAK